MKAKIKENIQQPEELERLYREDRNSFASGFEEIFPEIENKTLADFWKIRISFDKNGERIRSFSWADIVIMIAASLAVSILIKLPEIHN